MIVAALIGIFAAVELRTRWDEDELAAGPTVEPSPTELPSPTAGPPSPLESPAQQTELPRTPEATEELATPTATIMAAESPTEAPTQAPTEEPTIAPTRAPAQAPTVPTPEPSGDPMPHTGGGAVSGGLAVIAIAVLLGIAVRRSYSSHQRS